MEQLQREDIIWMIQSTYEAIGLELGEHDLDIAIEMALDADRLSLYGQDPDSLEIFKGLSRVNQLDFAQHALRCYF